MILFKSGITKSLYSNFVNSLNVRTSTPVSQPFVYVDSEDNVIRLLTDTFENTNDEIMSFSVSNHGDMELLTTAEG